MKLFLSWSGAVSQQIAQELRTWFPLILPAVQPFLTANDIDKGARWSGEIARELEQCNFGVVCLTRENLESQWIAFEAGALSKQLSGRVATVLFGVAHRDVKQPLAMFQGTLFTSDDVRKLVSSINEAVPADQRREEAQLDTLFPMLWPKIETPVQLILKNAAATAGAAAPAPALDVPGMLSELLGLSRAHATILSSPDKLLAPVMDRLERLIGEARIDLQRAGRGPFLYDLPARPSGGRLQKIVANEKNASMRLLSWLQDQVEQGVPESEIGAKIQEHALSLGITVSNFQVNNDRLYVETPAGLFGADRRGE